MNKVGAMHKLFLPIVKTYAKKRVVKGPLLRPEIRDRQKTVISIDAIEDCAYDFLSRLNAAKDGTRPGLMHVDFSDGKLSVVESSITPVHFLFGNNEAEVLQKLDWGEEAIESFPEDCFLYANGDTLAYPFKDPEGNLDVVRLFDAVVELSSAEVEGLTARKQWEIAERGRDLLAAFADEVAKQGKTYTPRGSWMVGTQVHDEEVWAGVESGLYKGFSIGGRAEVEWEE